MPTVFIGVGSNLGVRESYFELAKQSLLTSKKVRGLRCSPVYETDPVDAVGGKFLNAVWSFETDLDPLETLALLRAVEKEAGRVRKLKNEPRVLDLDILTYGEQVLLNKDLTVPHPRMAERWFVLKPFCDLAPDWRHPVFKKTVKELLNSLNFGKRETVNG